MQKLTFFCGATLVSGGVTEGIKGNTKIPLNIDTRKKIRKMGGDKPTAVER